MRQSSNSELEREKKLTRSASFPQFSELSLTNVFVTPRMLLLESLQSKLLRCKLLEHLLDYACPLKITVPMSLSLLLHFMKNCTLAPDPTVNISCILFSALAYRSTSALDICSGINISN